MDTKTVSTRRRFFGSAGAALSAPLLVAGANAGEPRDADTEALKARLARLEDENAIRALNRRYANLVNAGARDDARARDDLARLFADPLHAQVDENIRRLSADAFGERDLIAVAADGKTATARLHCRAEVQTVIGPGCTLVDMARAQGEGVLEHAERGVLEAEYVKRGGIWKIVRAAYRSA